MREGIFSVIREIFLPYSAHQSPDMKMTPKTVKSPHRIHLKTAVMLNPERGVAKSQPEETNALKRVLDARKGH